jgi:signal transduction histidine kinase
MPPTRARAERVLLPTTSPPAQRERPEHLSKRLAWAMWATILGVTFSNVGLLAINGNTQSPGGLTVPSEFLFAFGYLALATASTGMVVRNVLNRLGWILLASALALCLAAVGSEYATYALLTEPGRLPGARVVAWFGAWAWWAGAGSALTAGLFLYPAGSLPSERWRPVAWLAVGNVMLLVLLHALSPGRLDGEYAVAINPFGIDAGRAVLRPMRNVGWLLLAFNGLLGSASILARLRSSRAPHRRQLAWLAIGAGGGITATLVWGLTRSSEDALSSPVQVVVVGGAFALPIAVVAAVMHDATLRRSVERVLLAREEERRRIQRDLHDGLGPTLAGIGLQLGVAKGLVRSDPDAAEAMLQRLDELVGTAVGDVRRILEDLRPPALDHLGLVSAIKEGTSYLTRHSDNDGFTISVEVSGNMDGLPATIEVAAFRIVMEAVTNAYRHARASRCSVSLARRSNLEISIADDGVGVSGEHQPGIGIESMCQRAVELGGTCVLHQRPGGGTLVRAELPMALR